MREDPILLTGVYRSGTTILSCMLGAHPEINFTYGSVNYLRWFVKKAIDPREYKEIVLDTETRLLKRYKKQISSQSIINSIENSEKEISHGLIYSAIMEDFFKNKEKRWGEKTLLEWTNIPTFLKMYSNSKALHIIRDPRDVVVSYSKYRHLDYDKTIEHMIGSKANVPFVRDVKDASNIEITGSWAFHYNSWKDGISVIPRIIIKYEDLLSNSEKIFTNNISYLKKI